MLILLLNLSRRVVATWSLRTRRKRPRRRGFGRRAEEPRGRLAEELPLAHEGRARRRQHVDGARQDDGPRRDRVDRRRPRGVVAAVDALECTFRREGPREAGRLEFDAQLAVLVPVGARRGDEQLRGLRGARRVRLGPRRAAQRLRPGHGGLRPAVHRQRAAHPGQRRVLDHDWNFNIPYTSQLFISLLCCAFQ